MTSTTILLIAILIAVSPKPAATSADVEAFAKFCWWVWRTVVVTAKLIVLTIAVGVLWYNVGTANMMAGVSITFVGGILGYAGLRIALWAVEYVTPNPLIAFIRAKTDPDYLTDGATWALKRVF
jgi:hypothetical protein